MTIGNVGYYSPILSSLIELSERLKNRIDVRIHLTKSVLEINSQKRAKNLFKFYSARSGNTPTLLFYINLRKRRFVILGDPQLREGLEPLCWKKTSQELKNNLRATQYERGIAKTIDWLGEYLDQHR